MSKPHGSSVLKVIEQEYEQARPPPGARLLGALSRTSKIAPHERERHVNPVSTAASSSFDEAS